MIRRSGRGTLNEPQWRFQARATTRRPTPPDPPKMTEIELIPCDFAKCGRAAERRRVLDQRDREVFVLPEH